MSIDSVSSQLYTQQPAVNTKDLKASTASQDGKPDPKLKKACQEMEAVFLNILLSKMRDTVPKSSLLGKDSGEEVMRSMLDTELSKNMAKAGGIGLADMLYRQLTPTTIKKGQTR